MSLDPSHVRNAGAKKTFAGTREQAAADDVAAVSIIYRNSGKFFNDYSRTRGRVGSTGAGSRRDLRYV